jgi:hypothetical protein
MRLALPLLLIPFAGFAVGRRTTTALEGPGLIFLVCCPAFRRSAQPCEVQARRPGLSGNT